jgi:hypothetical protein
MGSIRYDVVTLINTKFLIVSLIIRGRVTNSGWSRSGSRRTNHEITRLSTANNRISNIVPLNSRAHQEASYILNITGQVISIFIPLYNFRTKQGYAVSQWSILGKILTLGLGHVAVGGGGVAAVGVVVVAIVAAVGGGAVVVATTTVVVVVVG